jgi:hypothetical protein
MQLEQLIVVDCNITYAERTRHVSVSKARDEPVNSTTSTTFVVDLSRRPSRKKHMQGNPTVCFRCVKTGHSAEFFARITPRRKPAVLPSTQP